MAVDFYQGPGTLGATLRKCGFRPELLQTTQEDEKVLTAKFQVGNNATVHWDRASCSVWVEAPWPNATKIERRLRVALAGGYRTLILRPAFLSVLLTCLAVLLGAYGYSLTRQDSGVAAPKDRPPTDLTDSTASGGGPPPLPARSPLSDASAQGNP